MPYTSRAYARLSPLIDKFGQRYTMSTRSILGFIYTMEGLRNYGIDVDKRLKTLGIDLAQLSPDGEIERAHELRLITAVLENLNDPLAGLKAGAIRSLA